MRTLALLTSFYDLNGTLNIRKIFKCLSENLHNLVYIMNGWINFFPSFEKKYYRKKIIKTKFIINYKNIKLFNQKIVKSLEFANKNNLLIINNIGKSFLG